MVHAWRGLFMKAGSKDGDIAIKIEAGIKGLRKKKTLDERACDDDAVRIVVF
jgi:hypothetical protein